MFLRLGTTDEFYNITLERPANDAKGYDVLFVNVRLCRARAKALPWLLAVLSSPPQCWLHQSEGWQHPSMPLASPAHAQAAAKGNFTARMCHSCDPNCKTVPMVVGGRCTIGACVPWPEARAVWLQLPAV